MLWLDKFHEEHMAIIRILPKLEGNLKDIEYGGAGQNVIWELIEFATVIKNVLIPHFKEEDLIVYPKAASVDENGKIFISGMYDEHKILYEAFDGFIKSIGDMPDKEKNLKHITAQIISTSKNINIEETPKNFNRSWPVQPLEGNIDKEAILKYGYQIVQMLGEHIKKEETVVAELIKRATDIKRQSTQ
ncbi:hemerythrin domain-containing protein [Pelotomaculum isophthalicicum JI]|uniref:Hemerythrin domain-containing protein n=1 Tax=Pelotomaculum isophthalicicum JI TaxID=947010 RepID=A0A9X4JST4_9FIRM|nr:hemerythrin domain-containing protein [Pelotomaculum isophthalicicum]MDF9407374.1 hemerythrin domain-containing protein [Pelotomaculum isophthalicicum JI]